MTRTSEAEQKLLDKISDISETMYKMLVGDDDSFKKYEKALDRISQVCNRYITSMHAATEKLTRGMDAFSTSIEEIVRDSKYMAKRSVEKALEKTRQAIEKKLKEIDDQGSKH